MTAAADRRKLRLFFPSATTLLTDHRGHGEGLIAWQLLSGLAGRGHEVVACVREVDVAATLPFEVIETGRRLRLESLEPFAHARFVERAFRARGGSAAFDAAHWVFPPDFDEIAFAPAAELPFFYGPHSPSWPVPRGRRRPGDAVRGLVRPLLRRRSRAALRAAAGIFVSVPEGAAELPEDVANRARVLPFGVDAARFAPAALPATPTVLFVGAIAPRKGVRTLLDAFARLRTNHAATLVLAGDGPDLEELRAYAGRLGLADGVEWLGEVPHDEVPRLLAQASLLCLPSVGEPFGMVVLEAMAGGRAVVAADGAGPRYLVEHGRGGLVVDPSDPTALAAGLAELLADRERLRSMGAHNRARVERELSWDRIIDELEAAYARAAA